MKKNLIVFIIALGFQVYSQPKFLVNGYEPVVDPLTKEIYYYNYYSVSPNVFDYGVFKTNFSGDYEELTEFDSVPVFANNEHKAIFWDYDDFCYEYNFELDTRDTLFDTRYDFTLPEFYFPDDNKLKLNVKIFDLAVDSMRILSEDPDDFIGSTYPIYQANSDSTFLFLDNKFTTDYDYLVEVNINTLKKDTLLSIHIPEETKSNLSAFAYNTKEKLIAISIYYRPNNILDGNVANILSIFDFSTDDKKLIYNSEYLYDDEPGLSTEYMSWNEENDKLILVGNSIVDSYCAIDVFSLKDSLLSNVSGTAGPPYGRLFEISWYDTTNIIYRNATYGGIYTHNIDIETDITEEIDEILNNFSLDQNYPNPFNPSTVISYELSSFSHVRLSVCNILGQEVTVLINSEQSSGKYKVVFDGSNLASGIYIYSLTINKQSISKKMVLTK